MRKGKRVESAGRPFWRRIQVPAKVPVMLRIRSEQLLRFKQYMLERYQDRIQQHLRDRFPEECSALSEKGVRELIRDGIERSGTYGVDSEIDVQRYIEWMIVLGPQFDTNPATSWMGEILRSKKLAGFEKMELIDRHATFARREYR